MAGRSILRALTHRNFRLFFGGQTLSLIGTWTQSAAMPWLVSGLTGSRTLQGLVAFSSQLPSFFLPPLAGVLSDRVNRRHLLMVTQTLAMVQAFGLAALVWAGHVRIWHLILFNVSLNAINAFDMTARQSFLGEMLDDREDLANAIALNSAMANGSRLFGPALAAELIATTGEAGCFLLNGISFFAVLLALIAMRLQPRPAASKRTPLLEGLREGWTYVTRDEPIRSMLLLVSLVSLVGLPYAVLLPNYVRETLGDDPHYYGWLMTSAAVGAFAATILIAWLGLRFALLRVATGPILTGICLVGFATANTLVVALPCLFGAGFGIMLLLNTTNTLLQSLVPDTMRGRVLSFYTMAFLGMAPLGSLVMGSAADAISLTGVLGVAGVLCVIGGFTFWFRMARWRNIVESQLCSAPKKPVAPLFPARTEPDVEEGIIVELAKREPAADNGRRID
jgi:MFS family permease